MYQSSFHSSWNALRICTTALNIRHSISWGFMVRLKFTWGGRLDHTHLWHIKYAYICYIIRYCCAYMMTCAYDLQSNRGKSQEVGPKSYKNCASDTHAHKSPCKHRVNETWKVNIDTYKRKIQVLATLQQCIPSCIYSTQVYVNSFCQLTYQFRHSEFHNFTEDPGSQSSTKRLQVLLPGGQGWWMRLRKQVRIHLHSILQWCWQIATKWRLRCYDHHM